MIKNEADPVRIPSGTVHRLISLLQGALTLLKVDIDNNTIEHIGVMVHRAMSMQYRSFHTPEHIFDLADPSDAHSTLAAIFHDIVYFQVDDGFHKEIEEILKPYILIDNNTISIRKKIRDTDRAFHGTAAIFGFKEGQILSPFAGLNEFLSALLMNSLLGDRVKDVDLLIATAEIEMTIPFRTPDKEGRFPAEILDIRLRKTNAKFSLGLTDDQIGRAVVSAVIMSNRDVHNFAEEDPARFLDNTWKLLPESNPELHFHGLYTIKSYSTALMKMEGFLTHLKPETVFQQYKAYPEQSEYDDLIKKTSSNLIIAGGYLGIKMISAAILLALAEMSGGDAPMSFFMGEINPADEWSRLTTHLPGTPDCQHERKNVLYRLLKHGRSNSSDFDLQNSPLSLFIYCSLDEQQQEDCINVSRELIKGERSAHSYMDSIPGRLVKPIAQAASVIAFTRQQRLLEISESFS
ncbi:MAG: hypothetical protein JEZ04_18680 [Spirochaetales bacterium]|nr:hypothetical protein [Spirochaetales bacterium]